MKETLFSWPEKGQAPNAPLQITKETVYGENQVTYMSDKVSFYPSSLSEYVKEWFILIILAYQLGLHRISNMDPNNVAISLHRESSLVTLLDHSHLNKCELMVSVYTPPNAANYGFSIFDEKTGKSSHIKQCDFYSRGGEKV